MTDDNAFGHYTQLLDRVDAMFVNSFAAHRDQYQCGAGCYSCCQPNLAITNIEAARIRAWLRDRNDLRATIISGDKMLKSPNHCSMLDASGKCVIYEVRPMICRSHGMPVAWEGENGGEQRDCCPLNFSGVDLSDLPASAVLSLDKINMILSVLDRAYDENKAGERVPITELCQ